MANKPGRHRRGESRLRVLTFTSLFPNAVQPTLGIFIYQRMAHLARRPGQSVQVVAPIPYFPRWLGWSRWQAMSRIPRQERIGELTVYHPRYLLLPKVSMLFHGLLMFLGSVGLVRRLKKETQFECIDAHYVYPDGFAAALLAKLLDVPFIVSARGTDINLFPSFRLVRPMIRWTLRQAAGAVAVCTALKEAMTDLGLSAERTQVIGNGVDPKRFQPENPAEARRCLGLAEDAQVVVAVGALIPRKGYQFLIPAFAAIAPRFPGLRLYIVGEGEYHTRLEALAREAGVADRVFLVGNRPNEELRLWFSAARVSCLVSSREGWPNVLLESLACGTPVVATRVWGVPEVIVSTDLGVMVDQNVQSIAAGLESALQRGWDREALVRHARTRTWEVVAEEVECYLSSRIRKPAGASTIR